MKEIPMRKIIRKLIEFARALEDGAVAVMFLLAFCALPRVNALTRPFGADAPVEAAMPVLRGGRDDRA
jgi:hypothetical protein